MLLFWVEVNVQNVNNEKIPPKGSWETPVKSVIRRG